MIDWKRQDKALVGHLSFTDGRRGAVILVGQRQQPQGAALLVPPAAGEEGSQSRSLAEGLDLLGLTELAEVLCMQERAFGDVGLPPLPEGDAV